MTITIGPASIYKIPGKKNRTGFYNVEVDCENYPSLDSGFDVPLINTLNVRLPLTEDKETFDEITMRAKIQLVSDLRDMADALEFNYQSSPSEKDIF